MVIPPLNDIAVISILTIIHIVAIIFTWKVGKVFNSKSWSLIVLAFIILLFRRVINFLDLFEIISYNVEFINLVDQIYLPMIVWILIGLGMMRLYYNITSSMHLEKKLKNAGKKSKRR